VRDGSEHRYKKAARVGELRNSESVNYILDYVIHARTHTHTHTHVNAASPNRLHKPVRVEQFIVQTELAFALNRTSIAMINGLAICYCFIDGVPEQ